MGAKSAIGSPLPVRGMTALIWGCGVLANRLFVWLDHARYVIITKRLMAYAGPSSNGRTLVFGTSYVGSNPAGPAIYLRTKPPSGGFFCRSASVCPDFGAYAIHPWRGSSHRDDQPIAKNKNNELFATFLRLGTPLRSLKAEKSRNIAILLRFRALICDRGNSRRSLIAKQLQLGAIFCFGLMGRPQDGAGGWGTRPLARLRAYALV